MATLIFAAFMLLLALAPLPFGGNRPVAWSLISVWAGLLVAGWALATLIKPTHLALAWPRIRFIAIGFGLLLGWIYVQGAGWAPAGWAHPFWHDAGGELAQRLTGRITAAPDATVTAAMRLMAYAGAFWLAAQLCRDPTRAAIMAWGVAIIGGFYALYGLTVQFAGSNSILGFAKWAYLGDLTSTFVNRNSYATYAGIGLVTTLALLLAQVRALFAGGDPRYAGVNDAAVLRGGMLLVLALLLSTALFLTHSRGGLLATLAGIGALLLIGAGQDRLAGRGATRLFAVIAVGAIVVVAAVSGGGVLQRMANDPAREDNQRALIWKQTMVGIADRPLLGHGYGAYESAFPAYQEPRQVFGQRVDKAHNTYLELMFELGIPATLLLLCLPGLVLLACIGSLGRDGRDTLYPTIAISTSVVIAVHALADFSVQIPAVALTWAALLGLGFTQAFRHGERRSAKRSKPDDAALEEDLRRVRDRVAGKA